MRTSRRLIVQLALAALLLAPLAAVPRHHGLRGIAVLDFTDPKGVRLLPVLIMMDDTLYDANTYLAQPRPLAVTPGNIYDGTKAGELAGSFTITDAHQNKGVWYGDGQFALPSRGRPSRRTAEKNSDQDERPVLRKPGSSTTATTPPPPPAHTEPPPEDEGRPTLRRGGPTQTTQTPTTTPPPPPAQTTTTTPPTGQIQPTLDHTGQPRMLAAVSDPKWNDYRSFLYPVQPQFEKQYRQAALDLLTKTFASAPVVGKVASATPPAVTDFRIYDLQQRNEPIVVLSGTREASVLLGTQQRRRIQWGTVVMRVNSDGSMDKLFAQVTDPDHLDTTPQLTLIDVVDLYGDGKGALLFEQRGDTGRTFAVYMMSRGTLNKLFETTLAVP